MNATISQSPTLLYFLMNLPPSQRPELLNDVSALIEFDEVWDIQGEL